MSNALASQNITGAINQCVDQKLYNARFCTYARVVAVDRINYTLTAQPLVAEAINTKNNKKSYKQLPPIQNVPFFIGYVPTPGEDCILIHLDRGVKGRSKAKKLARTISTLGGLMSGGISGAITANIGSAVLQGVADNLVKNKGKAHTLDNCIAICGFINPNTHDKTVENKPELDNLDNIFAERYFDFIYPVGSVYVCAGKLPAHFTHRGRQWEQIDDSKFIVTAKYNDIMNNVSGGGSGYYINSHNLSYGAIPDGVDIDINAPVTVTPGAVPIDVTSDNIPTYGLCFYKRIK